MTEPTRYLHPLFRLAALAVGIFIVTVFAMIATVFGDQRAPVAVFFNEHGGTVIVVEVIVTLVLSFLAMAADRRRTRREMEERMFAQAFPNEDETNRTVSDHKERHVSRDQEGD